MTTRVALRPAASRDIQEAHDWYESEQAGLGREFLDAVAASLTRIGERPEGYPIVLQDARRALLPRFPYSVYFRVREDEVRILAVVHQRRHPRGWQQRVQRDKT